MAIYFVNAGKAIISLAVSQATTPPKFVGWGTGAAQAVTATDLTTPKALDLAAAGPARTTGVMSQVTTTLTNDTFQVTATRVAAGAGTVTELGLFDAASAGNLCILADSQSVLLAINDSIAATFQLKFA